jgi:hypothetical protein
MNKARATTRWLQNIRHGHITTRSEGNTASVVGTSITCTGQESAGRDRDNWNPRYGMRNPCKLSFSSFDTLEPQAHLSTGQCGQWTVREHDKNPDYVGSSAKPSIHVTSGTSMLHYEPHRPTEVNLPSLSTPAVKTPGEISAREEKKEKKQLEIQRKRRVSDDPYALYDMVKVGSFLQRYGSIDLTVGVRRIPLRVKLCAGSLEDHKDDLKSQFMPYWYEFSVSTIPKPARHLLDKSDESSTSGPSLRSGVSISSATTLGANSETSVHTFGSSIWSNFTRTTLGDSSSDATKKSIWSFFRRGGRSSMSSGDDSSSGSDSGVSASSGRGRFRWLRRRQ